MLSGIEIFNFFVSDHLKGKKLALINHIRSEFLEHNLCEALF